VKYFAYGSNMCSSRIKKRVPSCTFFDVGTLNGYVLKFHKKSLDGSGKCNVIPSEDETSEVIGVVFNFDPNEKKLLDKAEGQEYREIPVEIVTLQGVVSAYMYVAASDSIDDSLIPFTWYKDFVVEGAKEHALPEKYLQTIMKVHAKSDPDKKREQENKKMLPCKS
jgi:hypothetical protein